MLEKFFIVTSVVWAFYAVFWDGMILGPVSRWLSYRIPTWLQFILWACPVCMTPYYGSAVYWTLWHNSVLEWIVCIMGALGVSAIILNFQNSSKTDMPDPHEN